MRCRRDCIQPRAVSVVCRWKRRLGSSCSTCCSGLTGPWSRRLPLAQRRSALIWEKAAIAGKLIVTPYSLDLAQATGWLDDFGHDGRDGVVAKRLDAPYLSGERAMLRSSGCEPPIAWLRASAIRATHTRSDPFCSVSTTPKGKLDHVGFTSTIANDERGALTRTLRALRAAPDFTGKAPGGPSRWSSERSAEWEPLRPELVVEVRDACDGRSIPPRQSCFAGARQAGATVHNGSNSLAAPRDRISLPATRGEVLIVDRRQPLRRGEIVNGVDVEERVERFGWPFDGRPAKARGPLADFRTPRPRRVRSASRGDVPKPTTDRIEPWTPRLRFSISAIKGWLRRATRSRAERDSPPERLVPTPRSAVGCGPVEGGEDFPAAAPEALHAVAITGKPNDAKRRGSPLALIGRHSH